MDPKLLDILVCPLCKGPLIHRRDEKELAAYLTRLEEAERRDHRRLGRELELFTFDPDVGAGSGVRIDGWRVRWLTWCR